MRYRTGPVALLLLALAAAAFVQPVPAHAGTIVAMAEQVTDQRAPDARGDDDDDDDDRDDDRECRGRSRRWCEIPEVPWTVVLPVASLGIAVGYYLVQRRTGASEATDADRS